MKPRPAPKAPKAPSHLLAAAALAALTLLAFWNSFDGGFVLDNRALLLNDPRLRDATAANLKLILQHTYWWPTGEGGVYRPFATLSYLFNYAILGNQDHPFGYHAINFLIHFFNAVLVYALATRFIRKFWPSFFIAAIWAVHPVLTESVTNMVGRADLLAATGTLGAFLLYLRSTETIGTQRWISLAGVGAFTAIGVFSKENAVVIPGVIVLYELIFRRKDQWKEGIAGLIAALIPLALMFYQRAIVLAASLPKEVPFTDNPIMGATFWAGHLTAIDVLARYLWIMIWPATLSADYSWSEIPTARGSIGDWAALALILALLPGLVFLFRRNRGAFFLVCFAIAWLAPVSNVIFPIGSIMAERFLYIPLLGVAVCAVLVTYDAATRFRLPAYAPTAICLAIVAALSARTLVRNADWNDDLSMATATVQAAPGSFKSHDLLANVLYASDPTHTNIDRVIGESEKSLAILNPLPDERNLPDPYQLAGTAYLHRGDTRRNELDYRKAIAALLRFLLVEKANFADFQRKLRPGGPSAQSAERITAERQGSVYTLLSMAYMRTGDTADAAYAAAQANKLNPVSSELYRQRAAVAIAAGRLDEAAATYIEGAFVMSDGSLRQALVEMYQQTQGPGSCALVQGPRGLALNPKCPVVHANICAAEEGTIRTLSAAGQNELAGTRRRMFETEFGCP
jgi:tetratricopeptide (TPR) repeat protein